MRSQVARSSSRAIRPCAEQLLGQEQARAVADRVAQAGQDRVLRLGPPKLERVPAAREGARGRVGERHERLHQREAGSVALRDHAIGAPVGVADHEPTIALERRADPCEEAGEGGAFHVVDHVVEQHGVVAVGLQARVVGQRAQHLHLAPRLARQPFAYGLQAARVHVHGGHPAAGPDGLGQVEGPGPPSAAHVGDRLAAARCDQPQELGGLGRERVGRDALRRRPYESERQAGEHERGAQHGTTPGGAGAAPLCPRAGPCRVRAACR